MKKTLFAVWIFSAVFFVLSASESKPEFSVKIFLTKAVNLEDQFAGILPERPPHFSVISRVSCGEPFEVGIVFVGAAIRDGSVRLEGKIVMTDPKGEKKELPLIGSIAKVSGDTSGVFLFPQRLQVIYEPDDPKGTFTFDVELTDCHAHKTASASASLVYGEAPEPKSGEKAFDRLSRYYREPAPEYIIPAFREFLANLPKQKACLCG